jgi:hypothetical protein
LSASTWIAVSALHAPNAPSPMLMRPLGMVTLVRPGAAAESRGAQVSDAVRERGVGELVQPPKAESPMLLRLVPNETLPRLVQPVKAIGPMLVTLSGKLMPARLVQSQKAPQSIVSSWCRTSRCAGFCN